MYLESAQLIQFAVAILAAVLIFVGAYAAPLRISVAILLVLIPFQPVATSYGSANVIMTYVLFGALLIRGRLRYAPMLGRFLAVLFAYLLSMSQIPRSVYVLHGVEIIALLSGFLVFFLSYNLSRESESADYLVNVLVIANVLAILYCLIQLTVGSGESIRLFGSRDFALNQNRGDGDARLVGPFSEAGLTAAYFMSMTLVLVYKAVNAVGRTRVVFAVVAVVNVAMIIATANRGSFLVLIAGLLWFLYAFRSQLGFSRIVRVLTVSVIVIFGSASIVATYTDFGQMFDRLAKTTETEDGIPTTRAALWPVAWENIKEKPILGHGPRIVQQKELRYRNVPDEQLVAPFSHSLYLHLLVTVGVIGTLCMLFLLFGMVWRVYASVRQGEFTNEYEKGWAKVGIIVLSCFLVDELKIEFLRYTTVDYAHFVFLLFGLFLGRADDALARARSTARTSASRVSRRRLIGEDPEYV
jgi:O-antigen ligase